MTTELGAASGLNVSRETRGKLDRFVELLKQEAAGQNLVSAATLPDAWKRHIIDSAQLIKFGASGASWVDVGSGAGLPGMVLGILGAEILLIEPRKLRADFLERARVRLHVGNVQIAPTKVEQVTGRYDIITARAVAPLSKLLGITAHLAHAGTVWVLLKGQSAKNELAEAERSWQYDVRAEPSCTHAESSILLLSNVRAKRK